jgi:uncharacterized protein (TIGR00251 family)
VPGSFIIEEGDGVRINLRVSPGAKRTEVKGLYGGDALKLSVAAPPVGGRANDEIRRFLARSAGVPVSRVEIVRGGSGRSKQVAIRGIGARAVREAIGP